MAGYGGQERVPCRENTEWMENYPASVIFPTMLAPEMRRWGPATSQELEAPLPTVHLLMQELEAMTKRENVLVQELNAGKRIEAILSVNLAASKTRQEELQLKESRTQKEKETERSNLEAEIAEWKDLYSSAFTSYQGVEKEIRMKDRECKVAEQAVTAQIEELQSQLVAKQAEVAGMKAELAGKETQLAGKETALARKQTQLDELVVTVSQKDVKILALQSKLDELAVTVSEKDVEILALQSKLDELAVTVSQKDVKVLALQSQFDELAVTVSQKDVKILALQLQFDESTVTVSQKDVKISALQSQVAEAEEDKKAAFDELNHVLNRTISILWDVSEQVFTLTVDLKKFQLGNKYEYKTTTPTTRPLQETPCTGTLLSCGQEVEKRINCAESALAEAAETWKKSVAGLEVMQSFGRKCILDKILGKELACDAGEEMSIEMDQI